MSRRTIITIVVTPIAVVLLGYLAHSIDIVGLARSLHGS